MHFLLRAVIASGLALSAAQASAVQIKFTNHTGGKVCLATDWVKDASQQWRAVSGWECLDDQASTEWKPFVGQAYATVYTDLAGTPVNYVEKHDLGLTKDVLPLPKTIDDKPFGLHYWNDGSAWKYEVDDGQGHYGSQYTGGAEWDSGLDHMGYKNVAAWIFDDSEVTADKEVILTP